MKSTDFIKETTNDKHWSNLLREREVMPSVKTYTPRELAEIHNVPVEQIVDEWRKGISVEMEHAKSFRIAKEIALDHLLELPDYYTRLEKMEKGK
jgi:hypothetical protein